MDERLIQIKTIFEIELDMTEDDIFEFEDEKSGWATLELFQEVAFYIIGNRLAISFYSKAGPLFAAVTINTLHKYKIIDFDIYENMYPRFDQNGVFVEMLYGDDADQRYIQDLIEKNSSPEDIPYLPSPAHYH